MGRRGVEIGQCLAIATDEQADLGAIGQGEGVSRIVGQHFAVGSFRSIEIAADLEAGPDPEPGVDQSRPDGEDRAIEGLGLVDGLPDQAPMGPPEKLTAVPRR